MEIQDIIRILKSRWKIIIGITAIITLLAGLVSFFVIKPIYQADTKVFIGKDETKDVKYDSNDVQMYQKLLKTYAELIKTNDLIENAINENNLDISVAEVSGGLDATPRTDTQILQISYKNTDNLLTQKVLVAVVDEFIKETKILIPNGTVSVIESPEFPQYPVSPNNYKNLTLGFLGGLIFGIVISFLLEYMDNTFKTKEQIEKIMGMSVIGVLPCEDKKHKRRRDKHIKRVKNKNLNDKVCEN